MPNTPTRGHPKPLVVIPGDLDQERGYKIKVWAGYPNYECIYCQYATLWIGKMEKHQALGDHPWAFPGQNPKTIGSVSKDDEPEY